MKSIFLLYLALLVLVALLLRRLYEFPMPSFLSFWIDLKWRKKLQPPEAIIEVSEIKKGMRVLDIGCGPGSYTLEFAKEVGKEGKVYALDCQSEMLKKLERKLKKPENKDIQNIETIRGDALRLPFPDNFFDLVFLISVLGEVRNKKKALREARRVLKDSRSLVISETIADPDYLLKRAVERWCQEIGFEPVRCWSNFFSYVYRFRKKWN